MSLTKDEIIRNEIILEAQKLFKHYGLKKTTMDDIAEACGKAKSTLYYYFKSKEEVFTAAVDLEIRSLRLLVKSQVEGVSTIQEKVINYLVSFHQNIVDRINLYRISRQEIKNKLLNAAIFDRFIEFEKNYLHRILQDAFDAGELKSVSEDDLEWFAEIMVVSFFGIVRYSIEKDKILDVDKLERTANLLVPRIFQ